MFTKRGSQNGTFVRCQTLIVRKRAKGVVATLALTLTRVEASEREREHVFRRASDGQNFTKLGFKGNAHFVDLCQHYIASSDCAR